MQLCLTRQLEADEKGDPGQNSIGAMIDRVFVDMDVEQGIEEPYKKKHDRVFRWRMLRSVMQNDLSLFFANKYLDGDL